MARKRSSYYEDYWPRYKPSRPREVDGIKAKSQRGTFVKNWWANRWIQALKSLMDSGRLSRGRSYARRGQVLNIDVDPGRVAARVQGSRRTPYKVKISLRPLDDAQWNAVINALAAQAIFSAQLLGGEMPTEIEHVFDAVGVPLFPASSNDLVTECSCPDWANPCKHIAAVYYLLGERFDADPFLLFKLRGRDQGEVIAALRERRAAELPQTGTSVEEQPGAVEPAPPLDASLDHFWGSRDAVADYNVRIAEPEVELALLKRIGLPDFVPASTFRGQMERVYEGVTECALKIAFEG
ncbi:MAG: SWIM zinc finger family protein [Anaerolineae bacterium]|nr:SWIM zinc finger family protein [Anaerolineae bacterium]